MRPFAGIVGPLNVLVSCAREAIELEPTSPPYAAQARSAERALDRAKAQAHRFTAGQPRHRKSVRTVQAVIEQAEECVRAIRLRASPDELMRRSGAMQRAVMRLTELDAVLCGQVSESRNEVVVTERPWTETLNVPDALGAGHGSDPVQHDAGNEPASVAPLGTRDQDAPAA